MVIGVANIGGKIVDSWLPHLLGALEAGLDVVSGMHARLADTPALRAAAERHRRRLIDVRTPPNNIPIANGRKRTGKRLLTVGTDCALGKKYTALTIARALKMRGIDADFRATGQTGIMIAGTGMPWALNRTIWARRQVTTDPVGRRRIRRSRCPSWSVISRTRTRSATGPPSPMEGPVSPQ